MGRYRFRLPLAALILPLALATVMSVTAMKRAQITNGASVTVISTDEAALAIGPINTAYASIVNGQVRLQFPNQQPGSVYTYNSVFAITHKIPGSTTVTVSVAGELTPGAHVTLRDNASGTVYWQNGASVGSRVLTPGAPSSQISVIIALDSATPVGTPINLTIVVTGQ